MKRPDPLKHLEAELDALSARGLLRTRREPFPHGALSFSSNDYLGLADRMAPQAPAGAGASRLVCGDRPSHQALESAAARLVGAESALVFTSGYAANVGLMSAIAQAGDLVVGDALNHASIIDGARLSKARIAIVPHLDADAVRRVLEDRREPRAWVVTESYFSMDADSPDLAALRVACDDLGAGLLVDEAHALGVLGPDGRGLCAAADVRPDAFVGTFGKAFGAGGAFVAGRRVLTEWLWNRARSLVFSTGLSPTTAVAALAGIEAACSESSLRERVLANSVRLRNGMTSLGLRVLGHGPIVPWVLGDPDLTVRVAASLRSRGIQAGAIRPPSVPAGTSRIRLTVTARHSFEDVDRALSAIAEVARCELR